MRDGLRNEGGGSYWVREHEDSETSVKEHCGHGDISAHAHLHATPTTPAVPPSYRRRALQPLPLQPCRLYLVFPLALALPPSLPPSLSIHPSIPPSHFVRALSLSPPPSLQCVLPFRDDRLPTLLSWEG